MKQYYQNHKRKTYNTLIHAFSSPETELDNSNREKDEEIEPKKYGNSDSKLTLLGKKDDTKIDIDRDYFEAISFL